MVDWSKAPKEAQTAFTTATEWGGKPSMRGDIVFEDKYGHAMDGGGKLWLDDKTGWVILERRPYNDNSDVYAHQKQERYSTNKTDYLDDFFRTSTPDQVRGAMMFTIGKYQSRLGKKDSILSEVTKIADYAHRWMEYEKELIK